jgi:hypothetical protein
VLVPMPEDEVRINQALIKAALLKREHVGSAYRQSSFDSRDEPIDLKPLELRWQDALEKARANRTVFAQRRLRPEDVMPEWQRSASCSSAWPPSAPTRCSPTTAACARQRAMSASTRCAPFCQWTSWAFTVLLPDAL